MSREPTPAERHLAELACDLKHPPSDRQFIRTGGCPSCRSAVVALVDGDREQEGTVVPTTRYMECKCLPDSHVPPNPFCEVHGRPSIAAPSGQGVGEAVEWIDEELATLGKSKAEGLADEWAARDMTWQMENNRARHALLVARAALATPPAAPQEDTRDGEAK